MFESTTGGRRRVVLRRVAVLAIVVVLAGAVGGGVWFARVSGTPWWWARSVANDPAAHARLESLGAFPELSPTAERLVDAGIPGLDATLDAALTRHRDDPGRAALLAVAGARLGAGPGHRFIEPKLLGGERIARLGELILDSAQARSRETRALAGRLANSPVGDHALGRLGEERLPVVLAAIADPALVSEGWPPQRTLAWVLARDDPLERALHAASVDPAGHARFLVSVGLILAPRVGRVRAIERLTPLLEDEKPLPAPDGDRVCDGAARAIGQLAGRAWDGEPIPETYNRGNDPAWDAAVARARAWCAARADGLGLTPEGFVAVRVAKELNFGSFRVLSGGHLADFRGLDDESDETHWFGPLPAGLEVEVELHLPGRVVASATVSVVADETIVVRLAEHD